MKDNPAVKPMVFFVVLGIFLFASRRFGLDVPINITTSQVSSEFSVVGEGKIDVTPDTLYMDFGVTVEKEQTVEVVQSKLTTTNNKIISAISALGVDAKDIRTSNFSINPNYVYDLGKNRTDGFTGNATITIKTKKLELAGKLTQEATNAGATNVGGTRFGIDDPNVFREQARDKAIANAKEQAQKLASSLGISLGRVTNIVEYGASPSVPLAYAEKSVMLDSRGAGSAAPNIEPGTQTITSTVTLYFEKR